MEKGGMKNGGGKGGGKLLDCVVAPINPFDPVAVVLVVVEEEVVVVVELVWPLLLDVTVGVGGGPGGNCSLAFAAISWANIWLTLT